MTSRCLTRVAGLMHALMYRHPFSVYVSIRSLTQRAQGTRGHLRARESCRDEARVHADDPWPRLIMLFCIIVVIEIRIFSIGRYGFTGFRSKELRVMIGSDRLWSLEPCRSRTCSCNRCMATYVCVSVLVCRLSFRAQLSSIIRHSLICSCTCTYVSHPLRSL